METDDYLTPDREHCALLTIDVQNDVLDGGSLEVSGTSAALPVIADVVGWFRARRAPIVHVVRLYRPDGSNVDLCRRAAVELGSRFLLPGTLGSQLARALRPRPDCELDPELLLAGRFQAIGEDEHLMYKPRWGAFFQTELEQHLRARGVNTIVVAGANFPNCPRTTIYEASERDFRVVLPEDAISQLYDRGRDELRAIGVNITRAREWIALPG
jgi:nicotinamidase-related amidase